MDPLRIYSIIVIITGYYTLIMETRLLSYFFISTKVRQCIKRNQQINPKTKEQDAF